MSLGHKVVTNSLAFLLASPSALLWAGPGFGTLIHGKKSLELQTRQPALVRLANTTIAFQGSSTNREYASVEESLLATLETELVSNEKTLVKKDKADEAEWRFDLQVTGFATPPSTQRTETVANSSTTYVHWSGSLNVAYKILDHSGRVYDANNVTGNFDKEFGASEVTGGSKWPIPGRKKRPSKEPVPHTTEDIKQILVHQVVQQIGAKLGNTVVTVDVQVAGGAEDLNQAATFLENRLWQRAIDELQHAAAFPKAEDESYRQYDLGLAFEAMSYDSKTSAESRANIYKAAEFYDKALEMNPKEKYFVESVARTKEAIARFQELDRLQKADEERSRVGPPKTEAKKLRVGDIVAMLEAGVPEDSIIESIRMHPLEFDPYDVDTKIIIAKSKMSISIQNEMRQKVGAPLLPPPAKAANTTRPAVTSKSADK